MSTTLDGLSDDVLLTLQGFGLSQPRASVLNTALIGPVTGTAGVANGRDMLSHSLITHDPVTAYNSTPRLISSPNSIVCGGVGGGKSSFVKTVYVTRPLVIRYRRAVIFDKKDQNG